MLEAIWWTSGCPPYPTGLVKGKKGGRCVNTKSAKARCAGCGMSACPLEIYLCLYNNKSEYKYRMAVDGNIKNKTPQR
ncbi:MAG: hypothetical protein KAH86_04490 [Methanosarcinales archaeon]|nr:hypothetical protein [Methanosarcinales archaeon]